MKPLLKTSLALILMIVPLSLWAQQRPETLRERIARVVSRLESMADPLIEKGVTFVNEDGKKEVQNVVLYAEDVKERFENVLHHWTMPSIHYGDLDLNLKDLTLFHPRHVYLLKAGTPGKILDRQVFENETYLKLNAELGKSRILKRPVTQVLWVRYLADPTQEEIEPYLELLTAEGQVTQDLAQAKSVRTTRDGVSGWKNLSDLDDRAPVEEAQNAGASSPTAPSPDSSPVSMLRPDIFWGRSLSAVEDSLQGIRPGGLWDVQCEKFIKPDGTYGPYGQHLMKYLDAERKNGKLTHLFQMGFTIGDGQQLCPNFKKLTTEQQENFLVWMIAAIAMEESNCNTRCNGRGPNGTVSGLLQLHLEHPNWYPPQSPVCPKSVKTMDPYQNLDCGVKMLDAYLVVPKNSAHKMYFRYSYWDTLIPVKNGKLNGPERRTAKKVSLFQACNGG